MRAEVRRSAAVPLEEHRLKLSVGRLHPLHDGIGTHAPGAAATGYAALASAMILRGVTAVRP